MNSSIIIHPDVEPGVIDNNMLIKCVLEQGPKGESGRLFAEQGVHLEDVETLRLEFQNIIRIDHLWMLKLKKLTLTHNRIEKIENLELLTNLKDLDISFNEITKIENLDTLVNIEVLMLNHNKITIVENMDNLEKLLVLSLAGNLISDYKQVVYLRRFNNLRSLSFKENPCCTNYSCNTFLKAALPNVTYIDYVMITDQEREQCISEFYSMIQKLNEADEIKEAERVKKEMYDAQVEFYAMSFVEYLSGPELLEKMFEEDKNGSILLQAKGRLELLYTEYKVFYIQTMQDLVEFGQVQHSVRENEVKTFREVINEARNGSSERSKFLVDQYTSHKEHLFEMMSSVLKPLEVNPLSPNDVEPTILEIQTNFSTILDELYFNLMKEEMTLYEQCEETRAQLAENVKDLATKMIEASRSAFTEWREKEGSWVTGQTKILTALVDSAPVLFAQSPELLDLMADMDLLIDAITQSTDNHMRFIDAREDHLVFRVTTWMENLINTTNWEEINRDRSRVLEINYFINNQKKEWEDLQNSLLPDNNSLLINS